MRPGSASALRINGTRYSLRGANPDLGSAANRLGTVYATSIDASSLSQIAGNGRLLSLRATSAVTYLSWLNPVGASLGYIGRASGADSDIWLGSDTSGSKIRLVPASGSVEQRNGVNPQSLAVYGTYTDALNYERLRIYTQAGGSHVIASEATGTGARRAIELQHGTMTARLYSAASEYFFHVDRQGSGFPNFRLQRAQNWINHRGDFGGADAIIVTGSVPSMAYRFSMPVTGSEIRIQNTSSHNATIATSGDNLGGDMAFWTRDGGTIFKRLTINRSGTIVANVSVGNFGVTPPAIQPATPATLAGVIAILQQYGLAA